MTKSKTNASQKTYRMVGMSVLTALIVVLQVVGTFFPTKPFPLPLSLIPIIVGAALYGAGAGAFFGAVFSVIVVLMCVFGFDLTGAIIWNANPFFCALVCMAKGTLAGLCSGLVFRALNRVNKTFAAALAGAVTPVVNTGVFLSGMILFFKDLLTEWYGETDTLYNALVAFVGLNFLVEMAFCLVITPAVVKIVDIVGKSANGAKL